MKKTLILTCLAALAVPTEVFAFSLRTVFEDAEASDPIALLWSLAGAALAFPFMLLAAYRRLHCPPEMTPREFWGRCTKLALRQLGPFFGLFYIAGGAIFIGLAVVGAIGINVWCVSTNSGPFELTDRVAQFLWGSALSFFVVWWAVSLGLSIRWLPKSLDE